MFWTFSSHDQSVENLAAALRKHFLTNCEQITCGKAAVLDGLLDGVWELAEVHEEGLELGLCLEVLLGKEVDIGTLAGGKVGSEVLGSEMGEQGLAGGLTELDLIVYAFEHAFHFWVWGEV